MRFAKSVQIFRKRPAVCCMMLLTLPIASIIDAQRRETAVCSLMRHANSIITSRVCMLLRGDAHAK